MPMATAVVREFRQADFGDLGAAQARIGSPREGKGIGVERPDRSPVSRAAGGGRGNPLAADQVVQIGPAPAWPSPGTCSV